MSIANELKIDLFPEKKPRSTIDKYDIKDLLPEDTLAHSLNPNKKYAYSDSNVPILNGFYTAHTNHYPIRIKPDDIWLLIVQAFSNHVNANSEELRKYLVNFDGKQEITISYPLSDISQVNKTYLEDFCVQINEELEKYLGKKLLDILTPNFSTSTYDSKIVGKLSIMGAFKKYFEYTMSIYGCGIPYIILEGTAQDYKNIISKAKELKKYKFEWYIERVIPHIEKMVQAKEGKIDVDYFKSMIQKKEIIEEEAGGSDLFDINKVKYDYICGWFLNFFAYLNTDNKIEKFDGNSLKVESFKKLANQMLIVPFKVKSTVINKEWLMKYKVGFFGYEQNDKNEIIPTQGWIVSPSTKEERESIL